jgi:alkylation response protein AidB-like acyl-CoA dehydrogenase
MDFDLTHAQTASVRKAEEVVRRLNARDGARRIIDTATEVGLAPGENVELLTLALAIATAASEDASIAMTLAMHLVVARATTLPPGTVGALALSSEEMPVEQDGRLSGRALWVAPVEMEGVALVGARTANEVRVFAAPLNAPGATLERVATAGLRGLACAHVVLQGIPGVPVGPTVPLMAQVRVLMAAIGLGIGRRALSEALVAARASGAGAAGEQTVQGLLADAATELDAAMLLTWQAAASRMPSLAQGSMAKLASTGAAQRAVERATQVVGVESFRHGHVIERLAQDVRALELFAGRTEALRAAVAEDVLPNPQSEVTGRETRARA